jgi:aspartate/methionine/tyrosine aminotransferase
VAKSRFIMSWGSSYEQDGRLVSLPMKRLIANRAKALFTDPQTTGNYFTYREAIQILGLDYADVYRNGRIDLDPGEYADLGWMCNYAGPPESALQAMREAAVTENVGPYPPDLLTELRDLGARKFQRERGSDFEVIGVEGAQGGIGYTMLSYVDPGDEVIMTDPAYFHIAPACQVAGGVPVRIPLRQENRYRLDIDEVRAAITTRTKVIVVVDPINPFGTVQSLEFGTELLRVAWDHDILVFNNITHGTYQLQPQAQLHPLASLREQAPTDHLISTSGMSKGYGMAAIRLGFLAGHPDLLKAAALTKGEVTKIHINLIAQHGAIAALQDTEYVGRTQELLRRNYAHVRETAQATEGVDIPIDPEYGFSCILDVSGTEVTAQELCVALFARNVAVYAGDGLGDVGAHEYIRVNFSRPDIWAFEKLREELPGAIAEARTGRYREGVMSFYRRVGTARGARIIAALEANETRRQVGRAAVSGA